MADKPKRGPPEKKGQTESFQVTVPLHHYEYLTHLATLSRLGVRESDVAAHILIRELDRMFQDGYHEKDVPRR